MEFDLNLEANKYLINLKEGEGYGVDGRNRVIVLQRTKNKIVLSNNITISIKKHEKGFLYLDSRSVVRHNKAYPLVNQVIRDIEGYLIYKNLTA